jgi:anti-sigma B factor antagonist
MPRAGVVVVRAIGEIDILTAPAWRRTLDAAARFAASPAPPGPASGAPPVGVAGGHTPRLVCDLSATTFLGATGLAVLVDLAAQTTSAGVDLRVAAGSRPVRRLLGLTGLDHHLATETSLDDAVMSAPSPGST